MSLAAAVLDHGACALCSTAAAIVWHDGSCRRVGLADIEEARERAADGFKAEDSATFKRRVARPGARP